MLTLKKLAVVGVGSDDEEDDDEAATRRITDGGSQNAGAASLTTSLRMGTRIMARAAGAKASAARKRAGVRQGSLEHLGLADCDILGGDDRRGIHAICDGAEPGGHHRFHGAFKVRCLCAQRRAGVVLNTLRTFGEIRGYPDPAVGSRAGVERASRLTRLDLASNGLTECSARA